MVKKKMLYLYYVNNPGSEINPVRVIQEYN
jgi:hypothetical protein